MIKTYRVRMFDTYRGRYVFEDVQAPDLETLRIEVASLYPGCRLEDQHEVQR